MKIQRNLKLGNREGENMLSIIVPIFQVEKYLRRGLESLLNQSKEDIEILLIDDGSTDNSGKICDEYEEQYENIRVYHQPNMGVSRARNQGIRMAKGEYISFFDPDDYVERSYYIQLLHKIEERKADIVFSGYQIEEANGQCRIQHENGICNIANNLAPQKLFLLKDCRKGCNQIGFLGSVCRAVFKKSIILENQVWFSEKIGFKEDLLFLLEYLNYANACEYLSGHGYHYCKREVSATSFGYKEGLIENEKIFLNELDRILSASKRITQKDRNCLIARHHYYSARIIISNEMRTENNSDFFCVRKNRREFSKTFLNNKVIKQMIWDGVGSETVGIVFLAKLEMYSLIRWLYYIKFGKKHK